MSATPIRLVHDGRRPARACSTCRHVFRSNTVDVTCGATGWAIHVERDSDGPCGRDGLMWEPRPPRVGLVGWFRRLLWGDAP